MILAMWDCTSTAFTRATCCPTPQAISASWRSTRFPRNISRRLAGTTIVQPVTWGAAINRKRKEVDFDPAPASSEERWKDSNNKQGGLSEVMERAYDMDAAWDFLAGRLGADMIPPDRRRNKRNDQGRQTLGTPDRETGRINEIVDGLAIDTRRIFLTFPLTLVHT